MSISAIGGSAPQQAMTGASMRMPPAQLMSQLFQKIDTAGTGSITRAQFDNAFQTMNPPQGFKTMGSDAIFKQLDQNGTGSVSQQDFVNGMKNVISQIRAQNQASTDAQTQAAGISASTQALQAAIGGAGSIVDTRA